MSGQLSRLSARTRLVAPAPLAMFLVAGAVGLAVLHVDPRTGQPLGAGPVDAVRIAYLRASLARNSSDTDLRLRLSRELLSIGAFAEAERVLDALREGTEPLTRNAFRLAVEIAAAQWRAAPLNTPARENAEYRLVSRLQRFAKDPLSSTDQTFVSNLALEVGRADVAADLAVRAYEAAGDGASVALGLIALEALLGAGDGKAALSLAERLAVRWPRDADVLNRAQRVALAQDDPRRARDFGERLIALGPVDEATLRRQLDLALRESDVAEAAAIASRLVESRPLDASARLTAANAAAWAGLYRVSLHHLLWLAHNSQDTSAFAHALRTARELDDSAAISELLILRSRRASLTTEELVELAAAVSRSHSVADAVAALADHAGRHPDSRVAWEALASFQERKEDFSAAVGTRLSMVRRFGASRAQATNLARLLWMDGRPDEALDTLRPWVDTPGKDPQYWRLVGDLGWDLEDDALAARALRSLWEVGESSAWVAERLILLERQAGDTAAAIQHAREGWRRAKAPRLLLLALDEAVRAERWNDVELILADVDASPGTLGSEPAHWLIRARFEEQRQRVDAAADAYRHALEVDPGSPEARAGMIWLYVAAENGTALANLINDWERDAHVHPDLTRAMAAARSYVARDRRTAGGSRRSAVASAEWGTQSFGVVQAQRLRLRVRSEFPMLGGQTEGGIGVTSHRGRSELEGTVSHGRSLGPRVYAQVEGALNEPADESAPLLLDGRRTRVSGTLHFSGKRLYASTGAAWRTWSIHGGEHVGSGVVANAQAGVFVRSTNPTARLFVFGSYQQNQLSSENSLLPNQLAQFGAGAGLSEWHVGPARIFVDAFVGMTSEAQRPASRLQAGVAFSPFKSAELSVTSFLANDRWDDAQRDFGASVSLSYRLPE